MAPGRVRRILAREMGSVKSIQRHFSVIRSRYQPSRTEFLQSIRHRTRAGRYKPTNAPDVAWTGESRESDPIEDPPARFIEELEGLGGHGKRVEDREEA